MGDIELTYALHLWLVGMPVVEFLFDIIAFFAIFYG